MTQEQVDEYWDREYYGMVERDWFEEQEYFDEQKEFGTSNTMMMFDTNRKTVIEQAKKGNNVAKKVIKYYEQYIKSKDLWSFGLFRDCLISLHTMGKIKNLEVRQKDGFTA